MADHCTTMAHPSQIKRPISALDFQQRQVTTKNQNFSTNKSNHNIGRLHNLCEANLLVALIELDVMGAHEHVTHDDERADRCGKILSHECEQTLILICEAVVLLGQGVGLAVNDEVDVWSRCIAINGVFPVERRNDRKL